MQILLGGGSPFAPGFAFLRQRPSMTPMGADSVSQQQSVLGRHLEMPRQWLHPLLSVSGMGYALQGLSV